MIYNFYDYNGYTKEQCFKMISYPSDWPKSEKKGPGQHAHFVGKISPFTCDVAWKHDTFDV